MSEILAVASTGGHWIQLRRLSEAFGGYSVAYVTVSEKYRREADGAPFYSVIDISRSNKRDVIVLGWQLMRILLKERPKVIITTGAGPGLLAIAIGKVFFGARTVWIDSIANSEKLSHSGEQARRFADVWLTQWPHLADEQVGPSYQGAIL